jgi:hypothetical protein
MEQSPAMISEDQFENLQYGFIKLFRSLTRHWIWEDERKLKWWINILLDVNHQDNKVPIGFDLIECKRGQSVKSLESWAKQWRVDKSTVRRFFDLLQKDSMIRLENLQKTTRLTVCNHGIYNDKGHAEQPGSNSEATPEQLRSNSNNKDKKYKNGKNIEIRPKGLTASFDADRQGLIQSKKEYEELLVRLDGKESQSCWEQIKAFIQSGKPRFLDPYIDAWNIFALHYKLQKGPIRITEWRRKKFGSRISEPGFDFLEILAKVKGNSFLKGANDRNWKVGFDFIIESEQNYTKILEEKYDW